MDGRPRLFPKVQGKPADKRALKDLDPQWLVIDSPAGLNGAELRVELRRADALIVPISPSIFDMAATARFRDTIAESKEVKDPVHSDKWERLAMLAKITGSPAVVSG